MLFDIKQRRPQNHGSALLTRYEERNEPCYSVTKKDALTWRECAGQVLLGLGPLRPCGGVLARFWRVGASKDPLLRPHVEARLPGL